MLPLSFFLPTLPSLHLCPFFGQSHDHLVSLLQLTLVCLAHPFPTSALLDSHALIPQQSWVVTEQFSPSPERLPFPSTHTESRLTVCFLSRHRGLMSLPPVFFSVSYLFDWHVSFRSTDGGSVGRLILSLWKAKNKTKHMKTALHTLTGHLGRGEIPNAKQ